jgi:lipopolysaccharide export system ATP-binding protein
MGLPLRDDTHNAVRYSQLAHVTESEDSRMISSTDSPLLDVREIVKSYNGRRVVDDVSFHVNPGEIVGLLGRNGAGKTTSFRMTIGMIDQDGGQISFDGRDMFRFPMYKRAQFGMGYLAQEPSVFQRLTVEQNLLAILETLRGMGRRKRLDTAHQLIEQFGLTKQANQIARTLSGGERRKLEIARALITDPKLILLDEPFSGVDPIAVQELQKEILRLRAERGIAVLLTDHNVRETLAVTDRSYILVEGKILAAGTPKTLIQNDLVRSEYLGNTFRGDEFDHRPE